MITDWFFFFMWIWLSLNESTVYLWLLDRVSMAHFLYLALPSTRIQQCVERHSRDTLLLYVQLLYNKKRQGKSVRNELKKKERVTRYSWWAVCVCVCVCVFLLYIYIYMCVSLVKRAHAVATTKNSFCSFVFVSLFLLKSFCSQEDTSVFFFVFWRGGLLRGLVIIEYSFFIVTFLRVLYLSFFFYAFFFFLLHGNFRALVCPPLSSFSLLSPRRYKLRLPQRCHDSSHSYSCFMSITYSLLLCFSVLFMLSHK